MKKIGKLQLKKWKKRKKIIKKKREKLKIQKIKK